MISLHPSSLTGQWISGHTAASTLTTLLCLLMTALVERREHVSACQVSLLNTSLPLHPVHNASIDGPGIPSLSLAAICHLASVSTSSGSVGLTVIHSADCGAVSESNLAISSFFLPPA